MESYPSQPSIEDISLVKQGKGKYFFAYCYSEGDGFYTMNHRAAEVHNPRIYRSYEIGYSKTPPTKLESVGKMYVGILRWGSILNRDELTGEEKKNYVKY